MISTRSAGLLIDTVVCLTLAKWETVSGRFGGYLRTDVMISTRSVELVIDTVVRLTHAKRETVSGQFGGYLTKREATPRRRKIDRDRIVSQPCQVSRPGRARNRRCRRRARPNRQRGRFRVMGTSRLPWDRAYAGTFSSRFS